MKRIFFILFLLLGFYEAQSQAIVQTYVDRCTGQVYVFTVPMNGQTVIAFYNRSQVFTSDDFTNGALQAWLEQTYQWWSALNPCSTNQATTTATQQTVQQTTQQATQAAANAASSVATPPPPVAPPPTTNATANTSPPPAGNQGGTSNTANTNQSSTNQTSDSGSGGQSTEGSSSGQTDQSQSDQSQESKSETQESEVKEQSDEGSKEETNESSEEKQEEKSSEEESESSEDESSEEEDSKEEGDNKDEKKKDKNKEKVRNLAPPILAANLMAMQMLDGTWSTVASFGLSQSSLTGQETYSANAMIWSNLRQFSLSLSKSKVHFWSEYEGMSYTVNPITGQRTPALDFKTKKRYVDRQNQIHHIGSTSLSYMNLFGTDVITTGYSHVIMGQNDNFWKGFVGGYAATNSVIFIPQVIVMSPALTMFGTKPTAFESLPRWSFDPMVAISLTPIQLTYTEKQVSTVFNPNFTYIVGTGINFNLTQRFKANLGINTINNTSKLIPTTFALTIGARFAF